LPLRQSAAFDQPLCPLLVVGDAEIQRQVEPRGVLPENRQSQRVKRHDRNSRPLVAIGQQLHQTVAHFLRRAATEGDRQTVFRQHAVIGDQVSDAVSQRARLAGARTGDDQQRTVYQLGSSPLIGIELSQDHASDHGFGAAPPAFGAGLPAFGAGLRPRRNGRPQVSSHVNGRPQVSSHVCKDVVSAPLGNPSCAR